MIQRLTTAWLFAAALVACTNNFNNFHFAERKASAVDAAAMSSESDARAPDASDGGTLRITPLGGPRDAGSPPLDAHTTQPVDTGVVTPPPSDAGSTMHMNTDAADDDAQVPSDVLQCTQDWTATQLNLAACRDCSCDQCTGPQIDCLSRGNAHDRTVCTALFACAIAHKCHDLDCYCSTNKCRSSTTAAGDGPCVNEMNAAAGGQRDRVNTVHRDNDPTQPLVKAVRAIGCATGQPWGSVGGAMTGKCNTACGE